MREIKFRCYEKERNIMQKVLMIWLAGENYGLQFTDGNTTTLSTTAAKEGIVLMQFLGLKDRYDVEIYEGDIIEWDYEYDSDYDGDMPIVKRTTGKKEIKDIFDREKIFTAKSEGKGVEVVGNIYQNPELLK